ncbi:hypothetical protein GH5_04128 [Leishmania sp. Ghana 2012 LV757]|uniref:hypothetical protein n=1 Tax=Leishmania sp. Ghana 2012 LV757 TaxID=2803181 RepID=UPI001B651CBC|nr:hypothetical protein GH5_04128 [Leishmania sp. Ghana 2012 LV757]
MMMPLLCYMCYIALPTPALIILHHIYFSNTRRTLQRQSDVLEEGLLRCRRSGHLVRVLEAVQNNIADNERAYCIDEDLIYKRVGENRGAKRKRYGSLLDFVRRQVREGFDKVRAARRDVVGALHKVRKTNQVINGMNMSDSMRQPAFSLQDFLQVGDANSRAEEEAGVGAGGLPLYYNPRMLFPSDLVHIPAVYVKRSEGCWNGMRDALGLPSRTRCGEAIPPRVRSLSSRRAGAVEARAFADRWREVGTRLGVKTTANSRSAELLPLAVRNAVRAHDPAMVVDPFAGATSSGKKGGAAALTAAGALPRIDGGPSGMVLAKLRYRWAHRAAHIRAGCCGLFGHVADETTEQRMQRLMARKVKREGSSLFERFLLRYYLPAIYSIRYVLLALLLVLSVVVCVLGSRIEAAGLPGTLLMDQKSIADTFAAMSDSFGQRGSCTFCGPYYRSLQDYRQATITDIETCSA